MATVEVLGIRHHGPGSARSVLQALDELRPDLVIIEGPPELDGLLSLAADPDLVPPVAALIYVTDEPHRASFYPFASFSPEWVALRWAIGNSADVRFADLPATNFLAMTDRRQHPGSDPIGRLAAAAGYDDPERWWEDAVEHRASSTLQRFSLIGEAMAVIREQDAEQSPDPETLRREAAMRKIIRAELRAGRESVVVVCGAYHAPVLVPDSFPTATSDNRLLTKLPRTKVTATWAPWTAGRLATSSGYGAGITAPGWYAHLFSCWESGRAEEVVPSWLTRVARTLRDQGLDAAPATVVDAVRLADALAAIRGRPSVGLAELTHASQAVLCGGSAIPLQLIDRTLVVGEELGRVPDSAPLVPLAQDLTRLQRRLRMKPSATPTDIMLDLRKDSQRDRSLLLHRLRLLGIDWGRQIDAGGSTGTFKEAWRLEWTPEFAVGLVEAGLYGTTVLDATENRVAERARSADLAILATLIEEALLAELPRALTAVTSALAEQTAQQHDTLTLLGAIEPLARVHRYGDVRQADTSLVGGVLESVVTRAAIGLRAACGSVDDDAAATLREAIDAAHRGVALSGIGDQAWQPALELVAADDRVHGLIGGRLNRILTDSGAVSAEECALRLSRRLSRAVPAAAGAAWLEGFLDGDALLLLHDQQLLTMIDDWVADIDEASFDDLVPLLRRTFARFEPAERRQLGHHLSRRDRTSDSPAAESMIDVERAWPVVRRVGDLLGLEVA
ncbi:DUF5682 family protein [Microlunatus soli]|uniref:Uncharacterized protein n=1 Tax=Microlunatus soli TaxID=630515 RepID=A0A1H1Z634_9ACTN|nr:DUF5682 family protein [Microlunatus soli]SDT29285.1 hypothetical protein SAMN04489812_5013 [Microlunatus soli]